MKPGIKSYGYGQFIVEHLVSEAAIVVNRELRAGEEIAGHLFLDVYTANAPAINLYSNKCQFVTLNPHAPLIDADEHNEPYYVMARNVALATATHGPPAPMPPPATKPPE